MKKLAEEVFETLWLLSLFDTGYWYQRVLSLHEVVLEGERERERGH